MQLPNVSACLLVSRTWSHTIWQTASQTHTHAGAFKAATVVIRFFQVVRGKKTKAAKAKVKYAGQDEEDRVLAMQFLASAGTFHGI